MKKSLFISIILIFTSMTCISGQESTNLKINSWSASLSFGKIGTFYYYQSSQRKFSEYYSKGITEVVYPTGINFRIDHKLTNRISVSSGFNTKTRKKDYLIMALGFNYYYEKSKDNRYIFEIPLQINYQILNTPKFIDPYISTGIRNSYFRQSYFGEYSRSDFNGNSSGNFDINNGKFIIFYDLGIGTFLNFSKSISLTLESNVTYTISGFGYLELQGGIRYSFK